MCSRLHLVAQPQNSQPGDLASSISWRRPIAAIVCKTISGMGGGIGSIGGGIGGIGAHCVIDGGFQRILPGWVC